MKTSIAADYENVPINVFRRATGRGGGPGILDVTASGTSSFTLPLQTPERECWESRMVWLGITQFSWNGRRFGKASPGIMLDTWLEYAAGRVLVCLECYAKFRRQCGMFKAIFSWLETGEVQSRDMKRQLVTRLLPGIWTGRETLRWRWKELNVLFAGAGNITTWREWTQASFFLSCPLPSLLFTFLPLHSFSSI